MWHKYSLSQYVLMNNLVAMETLLPWQQANCNNSALCEYLKSILSTYVPWDEMYC